MRWLWCLLFAGCAPSVIEPAALAPSPYFVAVVAEAPFAPSPYFVIPGKQPKSDPAPVTPIPTPSLTVQAPSSVVVALHQWLGDRNTVTVKDAHTIEHQALKINLSAGTSLSYTLSDTAGSAVFNEPLPTITAKVFGFSVSPSLVRMDLKADNTGDVTVKAGPFTKKQHFTLNWTDDKPKIDSTPAVPAVPAAPPVTTTKISMRQVVYGWSSANCPPCAAAKTATIGKSLPFDVEWDSPNARRVNGGTPSFSWQDPNGKWYSVSGWYGIDALIKQVDSTMSPATTEIKSQGSGGFTVSDIALAARTGPAWYELVNGQRMRTSIDHIVRDHGIDPTLLAPYRNNQAALDNIHGWMHTHAK